MGLPQTNEELAERVRVMDVDQAMDLFELVLERTIISPPAFDDMSEALGQGRFEVLKEFAPELVLARTAKGAVTLIGPFDDEVLVVQVVPTDLLGDWRGELREARDAATICAILNTLLDAGLINDVSPDDYPPSIGGEVDGGYWWGAEEFVIQDDDDRFVVGRRR